MPLFVAVVPPELHNCGVQPQKNSLLASLAVIYVPPLSKSWRRPCTGEDISSPVVDFKVCARSYLDSAGALKSRELTSRDWTTRHQRLTIFMLHGTLYELYLLVCNSILRHLCVLLYTALVFHDFFDRCRASV